MTKSPQHHVYCICGAALHAQSQPPAAATLVVDLFLARHTGEGHGLTDSRTASRNRAKAYERRDEETAQLRRMWSA